MKIQVPTSSRSLAATTLAVLSHQLMVANNNAVVDATCDFTGITAANCAQELAAAISADAACAEVVSADDAESLCEAGYPFALVRNRGYQTDKIYMDGGGELNTVSDLTETLTSQAGRIARYQDGVASKNKVQWPYYTELAGGNPEINGGAGYNDNGYMSNFDLDNSCDLNAVVCCFIADRDGAAADADEKTFADNSDVCSHELEDSADSVHIKYGWAVYEGDETPTYCHGFMWEDGDVSDVYKGNALFEASYRTTYEHGFTRNVEGGPMCACVDKMPTISNAACLEATVSETDVTYDFTYMEGYGLVRSNTEGLSVSVGACRDGTLNDKYAASGMSDEKKKAFKKKVLDTGKSCIEGEEEFLNEKFLVKGTVEPLKDPANWKQFVGERSYYMSMPGEDAFRDMYDNESTTGIIYRYCRDCTLNGNGNYRDLYYRRLPDAGKAFPEEFVAGEKFETLDMFMNSFIGGADTANEIGKTFGIWETFEDALAYNTTTVWTFCAYDDNNNGIGFPGGCGRTQGQRDTSNYNSYDPRNQGGRANHHAFFLHTGSA